MTVDHYANLRINAERLLADFNELSEIGATVNGGVSRLALSNEDLQARAWLDRRFQQAGLLVRDDDAGNLSGIIASSNPDAKTLILGSHLDSVPDGGCYDGSIGVLAALECLRTIKETGIQLPVHLEAIDFTDEEGSWHPQFGSRALTGTLKENFSSNKDKDYGPFRAALLRAGIRPNDIYKAKRDPASVLGYFELHIEQSDRLFTTGCDIGAVTNIAGCATYRISFQGEACHGGTTPMDGRKDALLAAAIYLGEAHHAVRSQFPRGMFYAKDFEVAPGTFNMIPEQAWATWECRHTEKNLMAEMEYQLIHLARDIAKRYGVNVHMKRLNFTSVATMAGRHVLAVEKACQHLGIRCTRLTSYAGHDAQIMSAFTPSGMIFIPSASGMSHSPKEFSEWRHVAQGANVLLHTILLVAQGND